MTNTRRFSFSLLTVMLLVAIVALSVSHYVMMRQVAEAKREVEAARNELEVARKQFGYLRIDDPQKIYITKVKGSGIITTANPNRYRLYIPPGHRFLIHVGETEISETGPIGPATPIATTSVSSWREGAEVLLYWTNSTEGDVRRIRVWTDSEELIDVKLADNVKDAPRPDSGGYLALTSQLEFRPEERVQLFWHGNRAAKRGIVVWMEPFTMKAGTPQGVKAARPFTGK
jgi:hypothetical protein